MAANPPFADGEIPSSAKWNSLVGVYDRAVTAIDVVSSVTETPIYSKAVGAGHMSTDRMLRLSLVGDYLNDTGADRSFIFRVKFGGTTIFSNAADGLLMGPVALRRDFEFRVLIANLGATNAQFSKLSLEVSSAIAATNGVGRTTDTPGTSTNTVLNTRYLSVPLGASGNHAIDTTAACTLEVTVQHPTSSASLSCRRKFAYLELL
jgi:hypothetical protein